MFKVWRGLRTISDHKRTKLSTGGGYEVGKWTESFIWRFDSSLLQTPPPHLCSTSDTCPHKNGFKSIKFHLFFWLASTWNQHSWCPVTISFVERHLWITDLSLCYKCYYIYLTYLTGVCWILSTLVFYRLGLCLILPGRHWVQMASFEGLSSPVQTNCVGWWSSSSTWA